MNRPNPQDVLKDVDKHLIYMESVLKSEPAYREIPHKIRQDLLREITSARKLIRKTRGD